MKKLSNVFKTEEKKRLFKNLLKSKSGGISGLVYEIVASVIVLSLLITVIYIFRNNLDIISNSAKKTEETDKIRVDSLVPADKSVVTGSDVISVIRFYSNDNSVSINVTSNGRTETYSGENYDSQDFFIKYDDNFQCSYEYGENAIKSITYVQK